MDYQNAPQKQHHKDHSHTHNNPADVGGPATKSSMAALASVSNPAAAERYLVFYNDNNTQLACAQGDTLNTGSPLYDYTSAASADVPVGDMANPSSLAAVLFDSMVSPLHLISLMRCSPLSAAP